MNLLISSSTTIIGVVWRAVMLKAPSLCRYWMDQLTIRIGIMRLVPEQHGIMVFQEPNLRKRLWSYMSRSLLEKTTKYKTNFFNRPASAAHAFQSSATVK